MLSLVLCCVVVVQPAPPVKDAYYCTSTGYEVAATSLVKHRFDVFSPCLL